MGTRPVCATKTAFKNPKINTNLKGCVQCPRFYFFCCLFVLVFSIIKAKQSNSIANCSPLTLLSEIQVHISLFILTWGEGVKKL